MEWKFLGLLFVDLLLLGCCVRFLRRLHVEHNYYLMRCVFQISSWNYFQKYNRRVLSFLFTKGKTRHVKYCCAHLTDTEKPTHRTTTKTIHIWARKMSMMSLFRVFKTVSLVFIIQLCWILMLSPYLSCFAFPASTGKSFTTPINTCLGQKQVEKILLRLQSQMELYDRRYRDYPPKVRWCTLRGSRKSISRLLKRNSCVQSDSLLRIVHANILTCEKSVLREHQIELKSTKKRGKKLSPSARGFYGYHFFYEIENCHSGHHWCCIFVGDSPGVPCFEIYCYPYLPYCRWFVQARLFFFLFICDISQSLHTDLQLLNKYYGGSV